VDSAIIVYVRVQSYYGELWSEVKYCRSDGWLLLRLLDVLCELLRYFFWVNELENLVSILRLSLNDGEVCESERELLIQLELVRTEHVF